MVMPGSAVGLPSPPNKNLYNGGSEIQNDFNNLPDLMQTFYRNYDAALGRWTGVDPQADAVHSLTVYQYAGNNPIMGNDPLGNRETGAQIITYNEFQAEQEAYQRQVFLQTFGYGNGEGGGASNFGTGPAIGGGGGLGLGAATQSPFVFGKSWPGYDGSSNSGDSHFGSFLQGVLSNPANFVDNHSLSGSDVNDAYNSYLGITVILRQVNVPAKADAAQIGDKIKEDYDSFWSRLVQHSLTSSTGITFNFDRGPISGQLTPYSGAVTETEGWRPFFSDVKQLNGLSLSHEYGVNAYVAKLAYSVRASGGASVAVNLLGAEISIGVGREGFLLDGSFTHGNAVDGFDSSINISESARGIMQNFTNWLNNTFGHSQPIFGPTGSGSLAPDF